MKSDTYYLIINPGTGGEDSSLFSKDLSKAYKKWAERNNIICSIVEKKNSFELILQGENIFEKFKKEIGLHRIQRIGPTEVKGRTHTSIISVYLLQKPKFADIVIKQEDVRITYFRRGKGNGGQNVNKLATACRLVYKGYIIECSEERHQLQNKNIAFERLREKVTKDAQQQAEIKMQEESHLQNPNYGKRGDYERNYNYKRNEVVQGNKRTSLDKFFKGDFSDIYDENN
jgi:peptide chain release factor 1